MNFKENDKFGIYILLINIIISLFLLSTEGEKMPLIITAVVSNGVAIIFNIVAIMKAKKKLINIVTLVLNALVLGIIVYLLIKKVI